MIFFLKVDLGMAMFVNKVLDLGKDGGQHKAREKKT